MTVLGWIIGGIASQALEKTILGRQHTLYSFVSSIVFALIFGIDQAIVLHQYISGWLWMLATTVGWLIANSVSTSWINYISSLASTLNKTLSPSQIMILAILSTLSYIISGVWLGFCQWLVLRRYTKDVWWWNFQPSISFFLISILVWLLSLGQKFIPEVYRSQMVYLIGQGFTAVILGVIPAISLCMLKRNKSEA